MPELWTPVPEGPHETFIERLHRTIARFADEHEVEKPLVEIELFDGARFFLGRLDPEPGFGMVTIHVQRAHDTEAPDAMILPIGTIKRIELRAAPANGGSRFGFAVPRG
ncbi:MAG TPA: hypothetical protein VI408_10375 [Gaiellaceae bacterium]